jgi:hypothetical protein
MTTGMEVFIKPWASWVVEKNSRLTATQGFEEVHFLTATGKGWKRRSEYPDDYMTTTIKL